MFYQHWVFCVAICSASFLLMFVLDCTLFFLYWYVLSVMCHCLCLMPLTCNPLSRRKKERDSLMRFVIVSIFYYSWPYFLRLRKVTFSTYFHWCICVIPYDLKSKRAMLGHSVDTKLESFTRQIVQSLSEF